MGKVYTQVITNCSLKEILPIFQTKISNGMLVFTDCFKIYDELVDLGYKPHLRIKHNDNEFAYGENHINGIENFWGLCKVRLSRFRGVHKNKFFLHLKECEWRYKNRGKDTYTLVLSLLLKNPMNS